MAHVPTVPNFAQFNFALGDTDAAITKQNGQNAALVTFGNELRQTMTTLNEDIDQVAQDRDAAAQSASEAQAYRDQTQEISEGGLPPKAGNAKKVLRVADDEQSYELDGLLRFVMPVGAVMGFPCTTAPSGWLKLNGAELSRSAYADLWAFAQASGNLAATEAGKDPLQFGPGDGSTTFTIPDHRGVFPRWWDDGRGIDAGRGIGESQGDQNKAHDHGGSTGSDTHDHGGNTNNDTHSHSGNTDYDSHNHDVRVINQYSKNGSDVLEDGSANAAFNEKTIRTDSDSHNHGLNINSNTHRHGINSDTHNHDIASDGGDEARPVNGALLACIRY
ncbi:Phage Tail Collar Domain protein [Halomonas sp. THAF12]|uniref:phage tail protein n=1 Tax=Halomonas sp. THAF12 TaxID=2587849 RepID=UPI0012693A5C|nr:phage tail protein [Halomonas sp. THAF12]QFT84991.1 Phage Tail Collar Domain protein [Halomonas sp. THAF12]